MTVNNVLSFTRPAGKIVKVFMEKEPEKIKWNQLPVDYVIDSTGKFTDMENAKVYML